MMKLRTDTEQKEFRDEIETTKREARLYYPVESQVIVDQLGDFVYYHALSADERAFVDRNADLNVDLVMRVYTDDRLLTREEFEALLKEGQE